MSSSAEPAATPRRGSIAVPIFALAIGAVAAATAILFFVTFSGPPPMQRPHVVAEIAAALAGKPYQPDPRDADQMPRRGPGPRPPLHDAPLRVAIQSAAPDAGWRESADAATAARLAAVGGLPAGSVIAFTEAGARPFGHLIFGRFTVAARRSDGWRVVRAPEQPLLTSWHVRTLLAMLLAIAALSIPAWLLSRAITRPLRDLANAAAEARAGATRPDFPRGGAGEVQALTRAVAAMHDRLSAHAQSRTALLGAIAHDLGTPLSRLAFWIENLPEAARDRAAADIEEMRAMIAGTLRFAREEGAALTQVRVELSSLLDSLVEDMQVGGGAVSLEPCPRAVVRGDPVALRRLFANLIENALRYAGSASLACSTDRGSVVVTVADDGPGLGTVDPARLFDPFVRGDPSRNRATGGTGLGLAIVRSIAERHGGDVGLANGAAGGAVATVTLPLSG